MIATLRKRFQLTIPNEVVSKLNLSEGDQFDIIEQDGIVMLYKLSVYPSIYVEELKKEVETLKEKIKSGNPPISDNTGTLFEPLEE